MPFISTIDGDIKNYVFTNEPWIVDQFVSGSLYSTGMNTNGQLGDNTITHRSTAVQTVAGLLNWRDIAGSVTDPNPITQSSSGGIKSDGTLWMWGSNNSGALGDNSITHRSSPVQTIALGTNWFQLAIGYAHSAAIKVDGTLWLWGTNGQGQVGDNTSTNKSSPVQTVAFNKNWKQISCGHQHSSAIKQDGTLWSWGNDSLGQLGDNSNTKQSSPVQTIAFGTNWKQVACGSKHTAAIKTDGTLWMWGNNAYGQLGDNSITHRSSPVQTVAGGSNWRNVACGTDFTQAIKMDGSLWLWGRNANGQLGDNSITHRSSPVQTVAGGTWKQIAGGRFHTAGIKLDGSLWTWGSNAYGQLGDTTITHRSSPVQIASTGTTWRDVACCMNGTVAIRSGV
jgi:alpha-tubulin suppressor-like RCC1 family protein